MPYIDVLTSADVLPLLSNPLKFDVLIREHMQVRHSRLFLEFQYAKEINSLALFFGQQYPHRPPTIADIPVRRLALRQFFRVKRQGQHFC
jgi:hypothetical protein